MTKEDIYAAAEAVRREMKSLNVNWFVEDAALADDELNDMTPYNLLVVAAFKAAGVPLPAGF